MGVGGTRAGRLSHQVLEEYYQTVDPQAEPRAPAGRSARRGARPAFLAPLHLEDRFSLSFWDSLIVAAAQQASCKYLLTEDLQDAQAFDGVVVVDPFRHDRGELGL